jgi:hypothetical protein
MGREGVLAKGCEFREPAPTHELSITMNTEEWPDAETEARLDCIRRSIRRCDEATLRAMAEQVFPVVSDPWYDKFLNFIERNRSGGLYLAQSTEGAHVIYGASRGEGVWALPGTGMGILQPKTLAALADIVAETND